MQTNTPSFNDENTDKRFTELEGPGPYHNLRFEACHFERCDFHNAAFTNVSFIDCRFADCDLAMAEFGQCIFNGAVFLRSRLHGIDWTRINAAILNWEFHKCVLDYGNFEEMKLKRSVFAKSSFVEASFDRADLREADFSQTVLTRATFAATDLRKADFRDSTDLVLDLKDCRTEGLRLRIGDAAGTLAAHGIKVSA